LDRFTEVVGSMKDHQLASYEAAKLLYVRPIKSVRSLPALMS